MNGVRWMCVLVAAGGLLVSAATVARAGASGSIVISAAPVEAGGAIEKEFKRASTHVLVQKEKQWTLYFLAFLKHSPGAPQVQLVFYDAADKKHEPINAFPIDTQASAKILTSSVSFGVDQGFQAGHSYQVLITRLIDGKEDVYARGTISLK